MENVKRYRSDESELNNRVTQVVEWKIYGLTKNDIVLNGVTKWGISTFTIEKYLKKASKILGEINKTKIDYEYNLAYNRYTEAFKRSFSVAMTGEKFNTRAMALALEAQQNIDKLTGVCKNRIFITTNENDKKLEGIFNRLLESEFTDNTDTEYTK